MDLASRVNRSTQALTWARLPAEPGSSSSETVWIESTTTRAGWWWTMASSMATTSLPARASRFSGTAPIRAARPLTWVNDSSAEANSTSAPVAATDASTWKSRVDLPTPGGPKTKVTGPGDEASGQHPVDFDHAGGHRQRLAAIDLAERDRDGTGRHGRRRGRAGWPPATWTPSTCSTARSAGSAPPIGGRRPRRRCRGRSRSVGPCGTLRKACDTAAGIPTRIACRGSRPCAYSPSTPAPASSIGGG